MSEIGNDYGSSGSGTPRWVVLAVAVLAGISLLALGIGWNAASQARGVEQAMQASVKQNLDQLNQRLAKSDEINQQLQSDLRVVTDKLQLTQEQLVAARKQTKVASATYGKKLTGVETTLRSEIATKANAEDVKNLSGDVTGVKNDLDATKSSIQMARSELGTLIARNHEEIDQLRRMGQRDYFEFTLTKKSGAQKVGGIQVQLRDTNTKKNKFTVLVIADDKTFEKKDRSVNEPIFFYTGGSRSALEFVVNKVSRTSASGYLSVPKSAGQQASASSSGQ